MYTDEIEGTVMFWTERIQEFLDKEFGVQVTRPQLRRDFEASIAAGDAESFIGQHGEEAGQREVALALRRAEKEQ